MAKAFVALVLSSDGQPVMTKYGFISAAGGSSPNETFAATDTLDRNVRFDTVP